MKTPSDKKPDLSQAEKKPSTKKPMDQSIARLMGLGERSVQKSYYPQLQQKIKELEKSESRYRLLAENISDVIWMLNLNFSIAYISPSIERMSGYSANELLGKSFSDLLEPDHARRFEKEISRELKNQVCYGDDNSYKTKELELKQINRDGSDTWIEIRISCFEGEGQNHKHLLGISRDITDRKRAEAEKEEIQVQLLQAQKMESIGTLAGGIAHDFNNLLTVINGYADLILKKLENDHPLQNKIYAIAHAGRRAENLTRQLLAFSRKQIFSPQVIGISTVVNAMDQMLRRLIGEDIHVETTIDKEISPISADQTQIEQIFTNLVVNARDALTGIDRSGFKKRITIETGQTRFNTQTAEKLGLPEPGEYVSFSVSDNGRGMTADIQKRIFEPFFTTKSKYKGTGLGLATIYGIVKQNQGSIRVYSEPGQGALFKIYWPIADRQPSDSDPPSSEVSQDLSGDEHILLVEDDIEVLNFAANALMSLGYEIHKAENGATALAWFQSRKLSNKSLPHLVVTDLIMPELGGKEFIRKARAMDPNLRVLYVSGHTDNHIVHNGMLDAGINFLQKPYSQQRLAKKIRAVLASV